MSTKMSDDKLRKRATEGEIESTDKPSESLSELKSSLKNRRKNTTLLRSPFRTLWIFARIFIGWIISGVHYLVNHRIISWLLLLVALSAGVATFVLGPSDPLVVWLLSRGYFIVWWVTLGVLSSIGLGTGLHTFVLYLGPYIAKYTMAITECKSILVTDEGEDAFLCPSNVDLNGAAAITFLAIVWKVLPACICWGAGTAIGELPPYFMSRQARLSGERVEELEELEEEEKGKRVPTQLDKIKLTLYHALQRWGFWAILVCASVPNPLFDLAGITCGHFLIPFWTFFGATFIGKAIIKVQIQSCGVVLAFNRERLEWIIQQIEYIIPASTSILTPFFEKQRQTFHQHQASNQHSGESGSWLAFIWNWVLIVMLLFFAKSIVESSVQEQLATDDQLAIEQWHTAHGHGHSHTKSTSSKKKKKVEKTVEKESNGTPSVESSRSGVTTRAQERARSNSRKK